MSRRRLKKLTGSSGKRVKKKTKLPTGVDSKLELALKNEMRSCEWKPPSIKYKLPKTYNPDAAFGDILIEIKGRFRTSDEARKYVYARDSLPPWRDIVFVFANPKLKMPNAKRRKNGTYNTHGEWAERHGFTYYTPDSIPDDWK